MRKQYHLGELTWSLTGWMPHVWRQQRSIESGASLNAEVTALPVSVPGSVQGALRHAGILPDWNVGLTARDCDRPPPPHEVSNANAPTSSHPAFALSINPNTPPRFTAACRRRERPP